MDLLTAALLGILEGLTEFLPISSTGHLVLASALLGFEGEGSASFKIVIQLGAILAIIVLYWRRFWSILLGLFDARPSALAFVRNLLLGFLPAAVIGVIVYRAVKLMLDSPLTVSIALIVGGIAILLLEKRTRAPSILSVEEMPSRTALSIGLIQCLAMIPGVSRSGATILGGLMMGMERKAAAEFSFFLAVPTMLAAAAYDLMKSGAQIEAGAWNAIGIGFAMSFITALLVVKGFLAIVTKHGFAPFAWYRIIVGSIALIWLSI